MNMSDRVGVGSALAVLAVASTVAFGAQRGPASDGLIVGQVIDATTSRPIGQAVVGLGGAPVASRGAPPAAAPTRILTGSDGRFVFRDLPPGSYTVRADKAGYLAGASGQRTPGGAARPVPLPAGGRSGDVVVRMWKAATIAGMVMDEAGEALVRVEVGVFRRTTVGGRPQFTAAGQATTDDRGSFRFGNLSPGDYLVGTTAAPLAMPLSLVREFARTHGGAGHGFGAGMQVGDFVIQFRGGHPVPPPLVAGRLRVYPQSFYPGSESPAGALTVTLAAGETRSGIDLHVRPSTASAVRGRIVGPVAAGSPVLQLARADSVDYVPELQGGTTAVDERGEFFFPTVTEGSYVLRVVAATVAGEFVSPAAGQILWAHTPVVVAGESVNDVTVVLRDGLSVRGHVEFAGSRPPVGPLPPIPVAVEPAYGARAASTGGSTGLFTIRTNASGAFATPSGLPGGTYVVRVTNSPAGWMFKGAMYGGRDISSSGIELTSDVSGVVLEFTDRWTGLQGTVRDARAQPDGEATVFAFPYDPSEWTAYGPSPRRLRTARTSSAGTYAIDPLPPGDYYVIALADEPSDWRDPSVLEMLSGSAMRVHVHADGKTTLDLRTR
jgi:hypothetical protein